MCYSQFHGILLFVTKERIFCPFYMVRFMILLFNSIWCSMWKTHAFSSLALPTFLVKITGSVGRLASELTVVRCVRQDGLELQQRIRQINLKMSKTKHKTIQKSRKV